MAANPAVGCACVLPRRSSNPLTKDLNAVVVAGPGSSNKVGMVKSASWSDFGVCASATSAGAAAGEKKVAVAEAGAAAGVEKVAAAGDKKVAVVEAGVAAGDKKVAAVEAGVAAGDKKVAVVEAGIAAGDKKVAVVDKWNAELMLEV